MADVLFAGRVTGLVADDAFVYFASRSPDPAQPDEGFIGRVPLTGGDSIMLVLHQSSPSELAL